MTIAVIRPGKHPVIRPGENTGEARRQAARSEAAADRAEESAAFAEGFSGPVYATVGDGEAATTEGQTFRVSNGDGPPETTTAYRRTTSGSVELAPQEIDAAMVTLERGGTVHDAIFWTPPLDDLFGSIAFGDQMRSATHSSGIEGQFNTYIGQGSGLGTGLTNQSKNTALGYGAGNFFSQAVHPDTGNELFGNTAVGYLALSVMQAAFDNTACGAQALQNFKNGDDNVAVGIKAGMSLRNGSDNAFLGYGAGENLGNDETDCDGNIFLGPQAGRSIGDLVTPFYRGDQCIIIGDRASPLVDDTSNEIVIGALAIGGGENTVTIGSDSILTTYLKGVINGNNSLALRQSVFPQIILEREGIGDWRLGNPADGGTGNNFAISLNGSSKLIVDTAGVLQPAADATQDLGASAFQFKDVYGATFRVGGTQVVGAQGAAVADAAAMTYVAPAGGATVDTEGRASLAQLAADVTDLRAQLNAALARLRAHGLIAT